MFTTDDLHLYLISNPPAKGSCSFVTTPITASTLLLLFTLISKVPVGFHVCYTMLSGIFFFSRGAQKKRQLLLYNCTNKSAANKLPGSITKTLPAVAVKRPFSGGGGGGGCVMRPIRVPRQRRPGDQVSSSSSSSGLSALFPAAGVRLWSGRKPCSTKKDSTSTAKKSSPNSSVSRTKLPMRLPFL